MKRIMRINFALLILTILTSMAVGQSTKPVSPPQASRPAATSPQAIPGADSDQQATRQDLQKMRVILNQMKTNLAFVGSTTTPLNHQFELDIEMWQALLEQMERRSEGKSESQDQRK